jgi:hypothetical protein
MKELQFRVSKQAWREISIKIKNVELFKEKYKTFSNEEFDGEPFHYSFFNDDFFNDCVQEVDISDLDWEEEDYEEMDYQMNELLQAI